MDAINLGPFLIPLTRAYVALALAGLILAAEVLARTVDKRFAPWGWNTVLLGLVAARLGFVLNNLPAYAPDPLSVLYVWQGGFSPLWGIAGGTAYTLWFFRKHWFLLQWALVPAGLAGVVWLALGSLTPKAPDSAETLPPLTFTRLDGTQVTLTEYLGQPVVLNLWATWCPPCLRELPLLAETAQARPEVAFVFLDQGEGRLVVQTFLEEKGFDLPEVLLDPTNQAGRYFRIIGLPTTLFFNAEGQLVARHVGELSRAALLGYLNQITR
ncbi:TlpA disulfide reductase family protein [Marinithermus hydrothermalis]|uniref:Redoxin domain protein n=1 Tax=Marinithermus hydrothermalis (strain DSM 14884 / JCM 11576 / T1) TaxID=869210 RepID=F2NR69_MARHT|nr:TlpA disulfide reductase family protein [Marinithermus hydrothermalis]AEB12918.1 Redoxin domain protein [Marinithermus hydrothermalis DSM 14884]